MNDDMEFSGDLYDMDLASEIVEQGCAVEGEPSVRFLRVIAEYEATLARIVAENKEAA